ncbi:uncharacterized protein METZ01_LOCUS334338, partial [marine metagenome]
MNKRTEFSRRSFLIAGATSVATALPVLGQNEKQKDVTDEPIIDVHQHTNYLFRSDKKLVAHQRIMGVTTTLLLPAGSA